MAAKPNIRITIESTNAQGGMITSIHNLDTAGALAALRIMAISSNSIFENECGEDWNMDDDTFEAAADIDIEVGSELRLRRDTRKGQIIPVDTPGIIPTAPPWRPRACQR